MEYVCKYRVCKLKCGVPLFVPTTGRHTTTDKQARKPYVLLASLTYCSYGICLECLKIMLLLALLLGLVIHLSLFRSFKKKWLHTTNLMIMQLATNNNVLFTQKKKKMCSQGFWSSLWIYLSVNWLLNFWGFKKSIFPVKLNILMWSHFKYLFWNLVLILD